MISPDDLRNAVRQIMDRAERDDGLNPQAFSVENDLIDGLSDPEVFANSINDALNGFIGDPGLISSMEAASRGFMIGLIAGLLAEHMADHDEIPFGSHNYPTQQDLDDLRNGEKLELTPDERLDQWEADQLEQTFMLDMPEKEGEN